MLYEMEGMKGIAKIILAFVEPIKPAARANSIFPAIIYFSTASGNPIIP